MEKRTSEYRTKKNANSFSRRRKSSVSTRNPPKSVLSQPGGHTQVEGKTYYCISYVSAKPTTRYCISYVSVPIARIWLRAHFYTLHLGWAPQRLMARSPPKCILVHLLVWAAQRLMARPPPERIIFHLLLSSTFVDKEHVSYQLLLQMFEYGTRGKECRVP